MTHLICLAPPPRPLSIAEITNAVASRLPLSAQCRARPEILVS